MYFQEGKTLTSAWTLTAWTGTERKEIVEDEEILSADLVYSDDEVLADFQEQCKAAAETPHLTHDLQPVAKTLIRVLSRRDNS